MSTPRNQRTLPAAGAALIAAACLTACSGPDRSDPRETADAYAEAIATGDTPAACELATAAALKGLQRTKSCDAREGENEPQRITLIGICDGVPIYVYRVTPDQPLRKDFTEPANQLVVHAARSGDDYSIDRDGVYLVDDPSVARDSVDCPKGFATASEDIYTD